jgi:mono/diheme cytochrome c family protein
VQGKGKMPGFENKLTSDQVQAVIAHVRSFGKK